ncbi:hypothetical protein WR25_02384 isoform B [Diploscapter pachys]|nr:hypothetical protein WR25_02384 isoform B [Diploscapter pachys]
MTSPLKLNYSYDPRVERYKIDFNSTDNCILYFTFVTSNVYDRAIRIDSDYYYSYLPGDTYGSAVTISPIVSEATLTLDWNLYACPDLPTSNYTTDSTKSTCNSTVLVTVTTDRVDFTSNVIELKSGTGYLYDFTNNKTNSSLTVKMTPNDLSPTRGLIILHQCDGYLASKSYIDSIDCGRILFFNGTNYVGRMLGYDNNITQTQFTSVTIYYSYWPQLYAQVYFYSPVVQYIDPFNQYRIATNEISSYLRVDGNIDYIDSEMPYAVEARFVNLKQTNKKYLNYVRLNVTAVLLVYEGFAEITGPNFPEENLIARISQTGFVDGVSLTSSPIYTFVAVGDDVYYTLGDTGMVPNAKSPTYTKLSLSFNINLISSFVLLVTSMICLY